MTLLPYRRALYQVNIKNESHRCLHDEAPKLPARSLGREQRENILQKDELPQSWGDRLGDKKSMAKEGAHPVGGQKH